MQGPDRYAGLDVFRALAALLVVTAHFLAHLHAYVPISIERVDRWNFVDFFFVLSGFVLTGAYGSKITSLEGFYKFLWARFGRLYPLHAATTLAMVALGLIAGAIGYEIRIPSNFDARNAISHLLLLQAWNTTPGPVLNSPSWSLSAELFLLLQFPVLVYLSKRLSLLSCVVGAIGLAICLHLWRSGPGVPPWTEATYDFGALRALPSFFAGVMACRLLERSPGWRTPVWITALLGASILVLILLDTPQEITIATFPILVLAAASTDLRPWQSTRLIRAFRQLSELSYGIFLLHSFVALALMQVVRRAGWSSPIATTALFAGAVGVTITLAWTVNRLFEAPLRNMLRRSGPPRLSLALPATILPRPAHYQAIPLTVVSLSLTALLIVGSRVAAI